MRTAKIGGRTVSLKANQAAKLRYRGEFGTSLTSDMMDLLKPLYEDEGSAQRILSGVVTPADILKIVMTPGTCAQEILAQVLWACVWSADRTVPDFDQWSEAVQDEDESALSLFHDGDVAPWAFEVATAVESAFLGIGPADIAQKQQTHQRR